jgi:hypothetical protein
MRRSSSALINVIILLALGGAVLFFGWAQRTVPPGLYGVMRTKTHGVYPEIIRDGEFRWVWYKLIPTNAVVSVYALNRLERTFNMSGTLPQAKVYQLFASPNTDFSYKLDGSFAFTIKPESLPALTESRGIAGQKDLEALENVLAGDVESYINRRFDQSRENREEMEAVLDTGFQDRLKEEVSAAFPDITVLELKLNALTFPDIALYNSIRLLYEDYLARQRQLLTEDLREAAARNMNIQLRLDELAKYGELLTNYPILLQYLGLEKDAAR